MHAIRPDDIPGSQRRPVIERGGDARSVLAERDERARPKHPTSELCQTRVQHFFRDRLRHHQ